MGFPMVFPWFTRTYITRGYFQLFQLESSRFSHGFPMVSHDFSVEFAMGLHPARRRCPTGPSAVSSPTPVTAVTAVESLQKQLFAGGCPLDLLIFSAKMMVKIGKHAENIQHLFRISPAKMMIFLLFIWIWVFVRTA